MDRETDKGKSVKREIEKYEHLLKRAYKNIKFVNLVMITAGIYSRELDQFFKMLKVNLEDTAVKYIIASKLSEICIRSSYYVLCVRMNGLTDHELMDILLFLQTILPWNLKKNPCVHSHTMSIVL